MKTWADTLIRVHKHQEDALKAQMADTARAVCQVENEICVLQRDLAQAEKEVCQFTKAATVPHLLAQLLSFCRNLQVRVSWCETRLAQMRKQENQLREQLRAVAEKRILLDNLRQKYCREAMAEVMHKEEELATEASLQQFVRTEIQHEG
jgi:flagellar biosynthesis chaperone FliJ